MANLYDGIYIDGAPNNTIGSTAPGERNVISGNASVGIQIDGPGASGNLVQGNDIGTDVTGSHPLGNEIDGIFINGAASTVIGGPGPAQRNVISGNLSVGVRISGSGAAGNIVQGNFIGTDSTGTAPLGNGFDGVFTINAPYSSAAHPVAGNVISANGSVGVQLYGPGSTGNVVQGNKIGTDTTGMNPLGNGLDGIFVNAATTQHDRRPDSRRREPDLGKRLLGDPAPRPQLLRQRGARQRHRRRCQRRPPAGKRVRHLHQQCRAQHAWWSGTGREPGRGEYAGKHLPGHWAAATRPC